jgi:hypothetical protein
MRVSASPAVVVLLVGNLLDAVFTLTLLQLGLAREVNPLLRWIYEGSPLAFVVGKLAMVQLALLLPLRARLLRSQEMVARSGAALYFMVVLYQLGLMWQLD